MSIVKEILSGFGASVIDNIRANIVDASGATSASLEMEVTDNSLIIFGAKHIGALEHGRKPTGGSPSTSGESLYSRIRKWIDFRNIVPEPRTRKRGERKGEAYTSDELKQGLAHAITTKIHSKGTLLYRKGGNSGVLSNALTDNRFEALSELFGEHYKLRVTRLILDR